MKLEKEIHQGQFRNDAHKLGVNLIYSFNWLNTFHVTMLKPHGITAQQFNVLRILRGQLPHHSSIKLIRERMLDKMSDASRIVEKLRIKGLINRVISEDDRRACKVIITEKGLKLLEKIDAENHIYDSVFSNLTPEEIKVMNKLLDKLRGKSHSAES